MQLMDLIDQLLVLNIITIYLKNMSNREQIRNYIELMYSFFKSLSHLNVPIKFVSVCESNHGGDNEYAATLALSTLLETFRELKHMLQINQLNI